MLSTIQEVDREPYGEPDHKPEPVILAERVHHRRADTDPEERHNRDKWGTEWARHIWIFLSQNDNTDAYQDEREERSDTGHFADDITGNDRRE
jgi:hypothetical protein